MILSKITFPMFTVLCQNSQIIFCHHHELGDKYNFKIFGSFNTWFSTRRCISVFNSGASMTPHHFVLNFGDEGSYIHC